jgi:hypothetical protein
MDEIVSENRVELPSGKRLLFSTILAMAVAALLLITLVLPYEYGVDPTRLGRLLGLTKVGQEKMMQAAWDKKVGTATPRTDEMTVVLKPGDGAEVKLEISKGGKAKYEWTASGGLVNHNTHGEGMNDLHHVFIKANEVESDSGELTAPFDGDHGWFWRNKSNADVTIKLKTSGEYWTIKRMF